MSFKLYIFNMKMSFESDTVIYTVERRSFASGWNGWRWVPCRSSSFPIPTPLAAHTHNIRLHAPSRLEVNNWPLFHSSLNAYFWGILYVIYQLFKIKKYKIHCQGLFVLGITCKNSIWTCSWPNQFRRWAVPPLPHHWGGLTLSYSWKICSGLTLHVRHEPLVHPQVCVLIVKLKLSCT